MPTKRQKYKSLYWCWKAIKQRTLNPNCKAYQNYGARGITVCDEWMQFEPFLEWALKSGWESGLDIDRRDNDGPYSPENCRWVSRRKNVNNRRKTIRIEVDGTTLPISDWSRKTGIPHGSLKVWTETKGPEHTAEQIKLALENGYRPKDYMRNHKTVSVTHVESGMKFNSIRAAARHFGINNGQLYNAAKHGYNTRVGRFIWEKIKN